MTITKEDLEKLVPEVWKPVTNSDIAMAMESAHKFTRQEAKVKVQALIEREGL